MRIAITGATGLLGRNLLFEFIGRYADHLHDLRIFVLGRSQAEQTLADRVETMVLKSGAECLAAKGLDSDVLRDYVAEQISCIDIDLGRTGLGLREEDLAELRSAPLDFLFHSAALTDLRKSPAVAMRLRNTNISGTQRVLEFASAVSLGELCYVGSAYVCGTASGRIMPDFIGESFRNPYEKSKLDAELLVRDFSCATGVRSRLFRPSTLCGRLIEPPFGATPKFDVFYQWAAWFLRMKMRMLDCGLDVCARPCELDVRITYNPQAGLNIVPADFAAAAMAHVCLTSDPGDSYHLVSPSETAHQLYTEMLLGAINVQGVSAVDVVPEDQNRLERLYYRTVGEVFTPYVTSEPMLFDTRSLDVALSETNIVCPPIDREHFSILVDCARAHNFGVGGDAPE